MNFEVPIINKTILVAGSTGSGKTQLIHCFKYAPDVIEYQDPQTAVNVGTKETYHVSFRFQHNGKSYNVSMVDSRGSGDVINELSTGIKEYMKDNFISTDLVLICIENGRIKQEIKTIYEALFRKFTNAGKEHIHVIVTHCEGFTDAKKAEIQAYVSRNLQFEQQRVHCLGSRFNEDIVDALKEHNQNWIKECQTTLRDIIILSTPAKTNTLFTSCNLL